MQAAWENNTEIDCSISSIWYQFSLTDINQAKWKELLPAVRTLQDNVYNDDSNYVTVTKHFSKIFLAITLSPGIWFFSSSFFL